MTRLIATAFAAGALAMAATEASAQSSETYGDWQVSQISDALVLATTENNAGSTFGSICSPEGCTAFFNPQIDCNHGESYPALINSPAAAFSVLLECEKIEELVIYSLPMEGSIAEAMSIGGVIGVAFPMASGEFRVARYSLTGSMRASARAAQLAGGIDSSGRQRASDNSTL